MIRLLCVGALVALAMALSAAAAPHAHMAAYVIKMDLGVKPTSTKYGELGGYNPTVLTVHVGDTVTWQNVNSVAHTATSHLFPTDGRVTTGTTIGPAPWSSGNVAPHQQSRSFVAAKVGVYRYSCGYHFSIGQRGVIVVLP